MSIKSILKRENKAAQSQDGGQQPAQREQRPTDTNRRSWTSEDMRQINRVTAPELIRSNSERSVRSFKHRHQQRSSTSSLRSQSRNTSFQGLAKVMEDGDDEGQYDVPPMPAMPVRYTPASASSSTSSPLKPNASGSSYAFTENSIGPSPLSTAGSYLDGDQVSALVLTIPETSPVDSEDSSNASSKSEDILELRSHPFSRPQQFVFHTIQDDHTLDTGFKGQEPMFSVGAGSEDDNAKNIEFADARPERRYFTRATPMGASASEIEAHNHDEQATTTSPKPQEAAIKPAKKSRLSFLRKSSNAVTAH